MTERPIIFNDAMVRAVLSGAKTETRRPIKWHACVRGDALWVREAWCAFTPGPPGFEDHAEYVRSPDPDLHGLLDYFYRADRADRVDGYPWRPSIHMPRCASRLALDVLEVRVEHLQGMTEADACAEGFAPCQEAGHWSARAAFADTWDAMYPAMPWRSNPRVWIVRFKRQEAGRRQVRA